VREDWDQIEALRGILVKIGIIPEDSRLSIFKIIVKTGSKHYDRISIEIDEARFEYSEGAFPCTAQYRIDDLGSKFRYGLGLYTGENSDGQYNDVEVSGKLSLTK
jgi:hypothetical protein